MEIRPCPPEHREGVIELFLRRSRSLTAALVTDVVGDEAASEQRTLLAAVEGDRLVGAGILFRPHGAPAGLAVENVAVETDAEAQGVGGRLHATLQVDLPPGTTFVVGQADRDGPRTLEVAEHWGFAPTEVSVTSRLSLDDPHRPALPPDVTVELSPRLAFEDEGAVERMLDVSQTNPERDHGGLQTLGSMRAMAREGSPVRPTGVLLRVGGRPAAISYAVTARGEAQVVYTGVDPQVRGRGLARLAKEVLHAELATAGATTCVTNNAEDNAGIRHVNDQLGYRPTDAAVFLRRGLAPS